MELWKRIVRSVRGDHCRCACGERRRSIVLFPRELPEAPSFELARWA